MTPDGSYVIVWTQDILDSWSQDTSTLMATGSGTAADSSTAAAINSIGSYSTQTIQYSTFATTADTTGPQVATLTAANGTIIDPGATVSTAPV